MPGLRPGGSRGPTMTTDGVGRVEEARRRTGSGSWAPTLCCASPPAVGRRPPRVPAWLRLKPNEVLTEGSSIAPTQNAPTTAAVTGPAPRALARRVSQAGAQVAGQLSPGTPTGTSRR